jgi:hypothetical protein
MRKSHKPDKEKLVSNRALISKADKGNSTVIVYQNEYHSEVNNFISNSNFRRANKDPTKNFKKISGTV